MASMSTSSFTRFSTGPEWRNPSLDKVRKGSLPWTCAGTFPRTTSLQHRKSRPPGDFALASSPRLGSSSECLQHRRALSHCGCSGCRTHLSGGAHPSPTAPSTRKDRSWLHGVCSLEASGFGRGCVARVASRRLLSGGFRQRPEGRGCLGFPLDREDRVGGGERSGGGVLRNVASECGVGQYSDVRIQAEPQRHNGYRDSRLRIFENLSFRARLQSHGVRKNV